MSESRLPELRWRCRRGMLELDNLLKRFINEQGPTLTAAQQDDLARLLECPDPVLLEWLLGRSEPEDPSFRPIVTALRRL